MYLHFCQRMEHDQAATSMSKYMILVVCCIEGIIVACKELFASFGKHF